MAFFLLVYGGEHHDWKIYSISRVTSLHGTSLYTIMVMNDKQKFDFTYTAKRPLFFLFINQAVLNMPS